MLSCVQTPRELPRMGEVVPRSARRGSHRTRAAEPAHVRSSGPPRGERRRQFEGNRRVASSGHGRRALIRPPACRRARRGRSRRRGAAPRGARAAARADRADRLRELHVALDPRGGRLGADEQVRRGVSRQALLRRLRGRRPDRAARDRPGEEPLRSRARERPAPRGRAGEHGRLLRADGAGRHRALAPARPRRPSHARPQGQLLGPPLPRSSTTASRARPTWSTTTRCSRSRRSTGRR